MHHRPVSVIITDLDNTLFDWFDIWYHPFEAMLKKITERSGVPREVLVPEIKTVHERYRTSEYAFLIQELPSLKAKHPGGNMTEIYAEAIADFRRVRSEHMKLYPGVRETLEAIKAQGSLIAGYTESLAFYSNYRVRKLGLDGLLDYLYSPEDHDLPPGTDRSQIRMYEDDHYVLKHTQHHFTPRGELKPNPDILQSIIKDLKAVPDDCVYVGDSP